MPPRSKVQEAEFQRLKADREYAVLDMLCEHSPASTKEIADLTELYPVQVYRVLVSLEARRYVVCHTIGDRSDWDITPEGRQYAITPIGA